MHCFNSIIHPFHSQISVLGRNTPYTCQYNLIMPATIEAISFLPSARECLASRQCDCLNVAFESLMPPPTPVIAHFIIIFFPLHKTKWNKKKSNHSAWCLDEVTRATLYTALNCTVFYIKTHDAILFIKYYTQFTSFTMAAVTALCAMKAKSRSNHDGWRCIL